MRGTLVRLLPVFAVWGIAAAALAVPARRVVDWFWMPDELLYERLAFSVASSGSPLPELRGHSVTVTNFLYPVILGLFAGHALVPEFLLRAHTLNAVLMTSAAVPSYLIARDALRSRFAPYGVAVLSVAVPWVVLASFLLTESVAYPAFLWATFLAQRAMRRPTAWADVLGLSAIAVAVLARTQFLVLLVALPLAVLVQERSVRSAARRHPVLGIATVAAVLAAALLVATGHGAGLLGSYAGTTDSSWFTWSMAQSFAQHAATLATGLALLPAILGGAWISAAAVRGDPFGAFATTVAVLLLAEGTSFDVRFAGGLPHDRYLFYIGPLLLVGFLGALTDECLPRRSLVVPLVLVVTGLATSNLPMFDKFNVETPTAVFDNYLRTAGGGLSGARLTLIGCTLLLVANVFLARLVVPRAAVAVVLVAATGGFLVGETTYAFDRLLRVNGTAGRPIDVPQGVVFDWIDRSLGVRANVTMVPYAQITGDYWANAAFWWDLEFWNRSVVRAAYPGGRFTEIPPIFPRLPLRFDVRTGAATVSPTRFVAESDRETRFRMRGVTAAMGRDVRVIDAGDRWQVDWLSGGLDDDGFTRDGLTAWIRVYPLRGQREPKLRFISFQLRAGDAPASARLASNRGGTSVSISSGSKATPHVEVCVSPRAPAIVRLVPHGHVSVYGDIGTGAGASIRRQRSVLVQRISLADEIADC
jgi:hypothetical protein